MGLIAGCTGENSPVPNASGGEAGTRLVVFAASSLTEAFNEAGAAFERRNPSVSVVFNFDGSQRLRTQLEHGARADVFASADARQVETLEEAGLVSGEPRIFATNKLAIIVPADDSPSGGSPQELLGLLGQPGTKLVLALPEVPVGAYAREALGKLADDERYGEEYRRRVLENVVSEETNVRGVVQKVALAEADAGIVYVTDASLPELSGRLEMVVIPGPFNVTAVYPLAQLADSDRPELAGAFIQFLLSNEGQAILARHGFDPGLADSSSQAPSKGPAYSHLAAGPGATYTLSSAGKLGK